MAINDNQRKVPDEKTFRELHKKFSQKLWKEHEDVLGNDMIEIGYADDILWELFMEYGFVGCEDEQQTES
jgi:hypothetical protein